MLRKLNLQLLAAKDDESIEPDSPKADDIENELEGDTELTFSEVLNSNPKYQSEFDKRVASAIDKRIAKERAEWEAESKMSADEKANNRLKKREQEIAEKEAQLEYRLFVNDITEELRAQDLPISIAETLAKGSNRDNIDQTITELKSYMDEAINEAIKAKARQSEPRASGGTPNTGETKRHDWRKFAQEIREVN